MNALNPLQLETLKLLKDSESDQVDVKELLVDYLSRRVMAEADKKMETSNPEENAVGQWRKQYSSYEA